MAAIGIDSIRTEHPVDAVQQHHNAGAARGLVTASLLSAILWLSILIAAISLL